MKLLIMSLPYKEAREIGRLLTRRLLVEMLTAERNRLF